MTTYSAQRRPSGAIPPVVLDDDAIVLAQAIARQERSQAFLRAFNWGVGSLRRLAG